MPRKLLSSLSALLLLLCVSLACTRLSFRQERPAPKDKGGLLLLIALKGGNQSEQTIASTISIIERRCNQLAIYCKLQRQAGGQIELRVSSDMQPDRVKDVLLSQGLELRAVVSNPSPAPLESYATEAEAKGVAGATRDVLPYSENDRGSQAPRRRFVVVERKPIVTGEQVRDARATQARVRDDYEIIFSLNPEGAYQLQSWTRTHINNYLAIVLNGEARSVAYIKSEISDSGVITGHYTKEQAEDIAHVLVTGNLPAPVEVIKEGTYAP
jgi:preprotein translocase subunit SecD